MTAAPGITLQAKHPDLCLIFPLCTRLPTEKQGVPVKKPFSNRGLIGSLASCHSFLYHLVALSLALIGSLMSRHSLLYHLSSDEPLSSKPVRSASPNQRSSTFSMAWLSGAKALRGGGVVWREGGREEGGKGGMEVGKKEVVMDLSPLAFPRASLYSGFSGSKKAKFFFFCQQEFLVIVVSLLLHLGEYTSSFTFAYFTIEMRPFESEAELSVEGVLWCFVFFSLGIYLNRVFLNM